MRIRFSFSSRKTGKIEGKNSHKKAFPLVVKEVIREADIIFQVLDARFIQETRNLALEEYIKAQGKHLIFLINKMDTARPEDVRATIKEHNLEPYVLLSCKNFHGKKGFRERIQIEAKRMKLRRDVLIGIVGYPNTGKSSIINLLIGRRTVGVSAQAGFTKGLQKIRFTKDIKVIDTPGVIADADSPATEKEDLVKSTKIGIKTYDRVKNPVFIIATLMREHPNVLDAYYKIETNNDPELLIETLGKKHNFLVKGGAIDYERTARLILKDWQEGKIKP